MEVKLTQEQKDNLNKHIINMQNLIIQLGMLEYTYQQNKSQLMDEISKVDNMNNEYKNKLTDKYENATVNVTEGKIIFEQVKTRGNNNE